MLGYLDPPAGEPSFDDEGWFHTGDLMERDEDGHLRLIDRKKEIYKNIKGETIAPQRIENLFRDFESVGRVFLVGDHREFNTALIWPNPSYKHVEFDKLPPAERKAHFRSIVTSVNTFLAPYERIVDFAVVERDFSADLGELTPMGTPRRKVIEQNFADVMRLLYRRASVKDNRLILSVGAEQSNSAGITIGDKCFLTQYLGDINNLESLEYEENAILKMRDLLNITHHYV